VNIPELWNTTQVAQFLGVKATSVSAYRIRGQMPPPVQTVGKQTHLWEADTIRAWHAQRPHTDQGD
jgi:predicted DNA-binding transcriptional regulator AlpA